MATRCTHLDQIKFKTTTTHVCEECIKMGDTWVHLRLCLVCGHVGCCDSSKNKHATKHFHKTKHPLIRSIEPGSRGFGAMSTRLSPARSRPDSRGENPATEQSTPASNRSIWVSARAPGKFSLR